MNDNILVTRSSLPDLDEFVEEIKDIWDTHWLTNMGSKHEKLKLELKKYFGVDNLELFVNGHMSLELTLQAMNLQGEVITTPFTFASTTHAIIRSGLKPVFCDIESDTYTLDVSKIERLINEQTSAILPVHVYGNICNVEEIDRLAHKYDLKVIYDAAHAFGETYKGIGIGRYGDASCFSFHATKVFNTIEGGAVCFRNKRLADALYELKNFGIRNTEEVASVGANAKMNEFSAAMGLCNLKHVNGEIEKRERVVERYYSNLENIDGIKLNEYKQEMRPNYGYFPIVIDEKRFGVSRDEIFEKLKRNGIEPRKYFYPLTNTFSAFHGQFNALETPVALSISKRVLTLPLYPDLEEREIDRICELILNCRKV